MEQENAGNICDSDIHILTELVNTKYGYDFSGYSILSLKRRLDYIISKFQMKGFDELHNKLLQEVDFFTPFLENITVNVTEMFRDPEFFLTLRRDVIPALANYPLIRIWHAGCSTGKEVYSLAIIMKELGLLERSLFYGTDINPKVLKNASAGKFPLDLLEDYKKNYRAAGGALNFSDYYTVSDNVIRLNREFREKMVFAPHNLVDDLCFNEFHIILCRNVFIYFNTTLQNHVVGLFSQSLPAGGYLGLGSKETINFTKRANDFEVVNRKQRIWKKIT